MAGQAQVAARVRPSLALAMLSGLVLGGCDPRECALGIAQGDCVPVGSPLAAFPQDDAVCRSYGLAPGTPDYTICRRQKRHVRGLTERATNFGVLEEPLLPDVRPIYQVK